MKHPIILTLALLWVFSLTADLNYNYAYMLPHIDSNDSLILFDTFPLPGETENSLYGVFYNDTQQEYHVAGYDEDAISVQYTVPNTVGNTITHAKVTGDPSDPLLVSYGEGLAAETLNLAVYSLATGAFLDSVNIAIQMNYEFGYILAADLEAAVYDGNITILAGTETSASYYSPSMEEQYYNFTEMLFYQFENQQLVYQRVLHGYGNYLTPVPELGIVLTTGYEFNSYDQGCSYTRSASSISLSNYEIVHTYFSYRGSECCGFYSHYPSSLWTTIGNVDFSNYPYLYSSVRIRDEFPNDEYVISKTHNVVTGETVSRDSMFMAPQVGLPKPMEIIYNEAWCYLVQQGTGLSVVDTDSLQTIETIPIPQGCIGLYKIPDEYRLGIHEQTNGYEVFEISADGPPPDQPIIVNDLSYATESGGVWTPENQTINEQDELSFYISANDPDDNELEYNWLLNGSSVSTDSAYVFTTDYTSAGAYTLVMNVTDNYQAESNYSQSRNSLSFTWSITVNNVGVDDSDVSALPPGIICCYPNPFNPSTTLCWSQSTPARTVLRIYDTRGRKIKTLADNVFEAGEHQITWSGCNDNGEPASSGVYLVMLQIGSARNTQRIIMLK